LQYDCFADPLSDIAEQIGAVEFTNAVATSVQTRSAMPGLAAGVFDDALATQGPPEAGGPPLLAEVLAEHGYDGGLWTDNVLFSAEYNYDRGFTAGNLGRPTLRKRAATAIRNSPLNSAFGLFEWTYFNVVGRANDLGSDDGSFYRTAAELHEGALEWLDEESPEPYLCWIHYMDAHHPYEPPARYLDDAPLHAERSRSELGKLSRDVVKSGGWEHHSREDIEDVAAAYRACCTYLWDELSAFVDRLLKAGYFDPESDILVLTADHGENLDPRGVDLMGHVPTAFWEDVIHVPLAISRPDWKPRTIEGQVSLIDVMPTVLDAVGVPAPDGIDGEPRRTPEEMVTERVLSVSRPPSGTPTYRAIRRASGWKLFGRDMEPADDVVLSSYGTDGESTEEIVHSSTTGDGPTTEPAATRWDDLLAELVEIRGPPIEERERSDLSVSVDEDHLRDLGYIE
jgi:arylsulfatase A-like enzyme